MTASKVNLFDKELQTTASLFKALGHPARLTIVKYLAEIKVCICGDILEELPLCRSTVIQHLNELKKVGLITGTVDGVKTNYCLSPFHVNRLKESLQTFIEQINTYEDCC